MITKYLALTIALVLLFACSENAEPAYPKYTMGECQKDESQTAMLAKIATIYESTDTATIFIKNDSLNVHVQKFSTYCSTSLKLIYEVRSDTLIVKYEEPKGNYSATGCVCNSTLDLAIPNDANVDHVRLLDKAYVTVNAK